MDDAPLLQVTAAGQAALLGEMTIAHAHQLRPQLVEALAASRYQLDLGAVSECDSAGVQLLIAAHRSAKAQGLQLTLSHPSTAVQASLQRYGLTHLLTE